MSEQRIDPLADARPTEPEDLGGPYGEYREAGQSASAADALLDRVRTKRAAEAPAGPGATPAEPSIPRVTPPAAPADDGRDEKPKIAGSFGMGLDDAVAAAAVEVGKFFVDLPAQTLGGITDAFLQFANTAQGISDALPDWLKAIWFAGSPAGGVTDDQKAEFQQAFGVDFDQAVDAATAPAIPEGRSAISPAYRSIVRFVTAFAVTKKATPFLPQGSSEAGRIGTEMVRGAIADVLAWDEKEARLSDLIQAVPALENPVTEWLASDEDDGILEGKLKQALEGAGIQLGIEGVRALAKGFAAFREGRRARAAAEAAAPAGGVSVPEIEKIDVNFPNVITETLPAREIPELSAEVKGKLIPEIDSAFLRDTFRVSLRDIKKEATKLSSYILDRQGHIYQIKAGDHADFFQKIADKVKLSSLPENIEENIALDELIARRDGMILFRLSKAGEQISGGIDIYATPTPAQSRTLRTLRQVVGADQVSISKWELPADVAASRVADADALAAQRAQFGEVTERDFMLLGDPEAPLFEVRAKPAADGAAKMRGAQGTVDAALEGVDTAPAVARAAEDLGGKDVFVNFARIEGPDDIKGVIGQMADAFAGDVDAARRGVQSHEQTARLADTLGMTVPDLLARRKGQPFNAEEALAARRLWAASAQKLLEAAERAASPNAGPVDQYVYRRMMATHYAIQAEVIGARTETARALNAWKIPAGGSVETARAVQDLLDAAGGPQASAAMAKRLAILAREGGDPAAVSRFVERGAFAKTTDAIKEVWINGLLSSPKTHLVNISSNAMVAGQQIAERRVAELFAEARGAAGGDGVAPGEAAAMTHGLIESLRDAFRLSWKALKADQGGYALGKIDLPRPRALSATAFDLEEAGGAGRVVDFLGQVFRTPGRLLGAEDEFFKTIGYRMELHAQAVRQATAEGLAGAALARRAAEIIQSPPEFIRIAAADAALYSTFTNRAGWFAQGLMRLRGGDRPLSPLPYIVPFLRTPANIARYSFERTPLAPLVGQWRADIVAGGARRDIALARMATGTAVMLMAADYADRGLVSGRGPSDPGERDALYRQGWKPYSIKVGDHWVSYNRADPFGMTMGFAADIAEAIKRGEIDQEDVDEWQEVVGMAIAAVSQVTINKTYLSGMAEFSAMMADPRRYAPGYVSDFTASFVPFTSLSGAVETAIDPTLSDVNTPWDAVQGKIAGLSERITPRRDLWGEKITRESGLGRTYDFFAPWAASPIKDSPIDAELVRLNSFPRKIAKKTSFGGIDVNLRHWPEVYDAYVRLAGNDLKHPVWGLGAKDLLDRIVTGKHALSPIYALKSDGKDGGKQAFIKDKIAEYRKLAQVAILADPRFADFAAEIGDARAEKLQQELDALSGNAAGTGRSTPPAAQPGLRLEAPR